MTNKTNETNETNETHFVLTTNKGNEYLIPTKYQHLTTVTSIVRAMNADGLTRGQISTTTGMLYQMVNNLLKENEANNDVRKKIAELKARANAS